MFEGLTESELEILFGMWDMVRLILTLLFGYWLGTQDGWKRYRDGWDITGWRKREDEE